MRLVPDLVLDEDATKLLCAKSVTSLRQVMSETDNNDTEPLNNNSTDEENPSVDAGGDAERPASNDQDESADEAEKPFCCPTSSIDIEAPAVNDERPISSRTVAPSKSDRSLPYSHNDVHSSGKAKTTVEKTMKGAEKVVKNAVKGTMNMAEKTATIAEKTAKEAEEKVKKTTKEIANLPHDKASSHWFSLTNIMLVHALGPLTFSLPAFLPKQQSVNLGLSHNRGFLYGTHTLVELFVLAAFISTCHYAIEVVEIPLKARAMAVLVGLSVGKLVLAFIGEALWSPHANPVFPIPFSFIVTTVTSVPFSLLTLRLMTPKQDVPAKEAKLRKKFKLLFGTLGAYILSLLVACVWGIVFRRLARSPIWQGVWVFVILPLELLCKIVLTTNLTTRLNSRKWIQLTLVVDLIFSSVQTAMLPYFANWISVLLAVFGTMASIAWRAYGGFDRVKVFYTLLKETVTNSSSGAAEKAREVGVIGMQVVQETTTNIHAMSSRIVGNGAMESEMELDEEMGVAPDMEGKALERSGTADTEESLDDSSVVSNELKDPSTPDSSEADPRELSDPLDFRDKFAKTKSTPAGQRDSQLIRRDGKQRHMYHIVDSVASAVQTGVVRLTGLITLNLIHFLTDQEHLNTSFQLDDKQFNQSVGYAVMFIVGIIFVILGVGEYIKRGLKLDGLTLNRVISYVFRDSFWFFFFWFTIIQYLMIAILLNHFGADYECKFRWLTCREPGLMDWPGCVEMEPSV